MHIHYQTNRQEGQTVAPTGLVESIGMIAIGYTSISILLIVGTVEFVVHLIPPIVGIPTINSTSLSLEYIQSIC